MNCFYRMWRDSFPCPNLVLLRDLRTFSLFVAIVLMLLVWGVTVMCHM